VTGDAFIAFILLAALLTLSLLIRGAGPYQRAAGSAALTFIGLIGIIFEKSRAGFPGPSAGRGKGLPVATASRVPNCNHQNPNWGLLTPREKIHERANA
jgi:hypothetical protein